MKIFLNRKPVSGPWGGGNKTLQCLSDTLANASEITYNLEDDVDIIYCQDPKPDASGLWFQDLLNHRLKFNSKIVQRVGDIGTHRDESVTRLVYESTHLSDFVIFPSLWAKQALGYQKKNYCIIPNAPLGEFYTNRKDSRIDSEVVRIITHHWSNNPMKGFDIYEQLGKWALNKKEVEFCYIGRYSEHHSKEGVNIVSPKDIKQLSQIIPKFDIYLTASKLEAGANHVLEGLACGLPVIYRVGGGSIEEYCSSYGLEYSTFDELLSCIKNMSINYPVYKSQVLGYNNEIKNVMKAYKELILSLR